MRENALELHGVCKSYGGCHAKGEAVVHSPGGNGAVGDGFNLMI